MSSASCVWLITMLAWIAVYAVTVAKLLTQIAEMDIDLKIAKTNLKKYERGEE